MDTIINEACKEITNTIQLSLVCEDRTCDHQSEFQTISGCCNNFENSDFVKILL